MVRLVAWFSTNFVFVITFICTTKVGLTQRFLAVQLCLPSSNEAFSLELVVSDSQRTRRRLVISSGFRTIVTNPLHVQLPLGSGYSREFGAGTFDVEKTHLVPRGCWFTLCLDLQELVSNNFVGINHRSLDYVALSGHCQLRRIFTLKCAPTCAVGLVQTGAGMKSAPIPNTLLLPGSLAQQPTVMYSMAAAEQWEVHASEELELAQSGPAPMEAARKAIRGTSSFALPHDSGRNMGNLSARSRGSESSRKSRPRKSAKTPIAEAARADSRQEDHVNQQSFATSAANASSRASDLEHAYPSARSNNNCESEDEDFDHLKPTEQCKLGGTPRTFSSSSSPQQAGKRASVIKFSDDPTVKVIGQSNAGDQGPFLPALPGTSISKEIPDMYERPKSSASMFDADRPLSRRSMNRPTSSRQSQYSPEELDIENTNVPEKKMLPALARLKKRQSKEHASEGIVGNLQDEEHFPESSPSHANDAALQDSPDEGASDEGASDEGAPGSPLSHRDQNDYGDNLIGEGIREDDAQSLADSDDQIVHGDDNESHLSLSGTNELEAALAVERERLAMMEEQLEEEERYVLGEEEAPNGQVETRKEQSNDVEKHLQAESKDDLLNLTNEIVQTSIHKALGTPKDSPLEQMDTTPETDEEPATSLHGAISPNDEHGQRQPSSRSSISSSAGKGDDEELDLVFDPLLNCYYCPKTGKYYKAK